MKVSCSAFVAFCILLWSSEPASERGRLALSPALHERDLNANTTLTRKITLTNNNTAVPSTTSPTKLPTTQSPTKAPTKALIPHQTKAPTNIECGSSNVSITAYINNITLSGETISSLSGTPDLHGALQQLMASNRIVRLSTCHDTDQERLRQRFGYLALMFSTGKSNDVTLFSNEDECTWAGVVCNSNKRFISFVFAQRGLRGTIPEDIGQWDSLQTFSIARNRNVIGSLPSSIGRWTDLQTFDVTFNTLMFSVPTQIANWRSIRLARFHDNSFTGTMPSIGTNNFCPRTTHQGRLQASCKTLRSNGSIVCECCDLCCDGMGCVRQ